MKRQAGFSFIEILVVMGIIVVLVGMVAVVVPRAQEASKQNTALNRVRQMVMMMSDRSTRGEGWPKFNGKNFVLFLVANNDIDRRNPRQLEMLFSPGDVTYSLEAATAERYQEVTLKALKNSDFRQLTSWAGRRNLDREYSITPDDEQRIVPIISDDDDGNVHHPKGLIMGYTDGSAVFVEWSKLDMAPPENLREPAPFLGDSADNDALRALSSE